MNTVVSVTVHQQLAPLIERLHRLWENGEQDAIKSGLAQLIADLAGDGVPIADFSHEQVEVQDYVKSWGEILNVQMYVDTEIYGERPLEPVVGVAGETVIQHEQGAKVYLEAWAEVAKEMVELPENLFTKLWTTVEIAKILDCSPAMLRRVRKENKLPVQVREFLLDCVSHDSKRSLWFVRPV